MQLISIHFLRLISIKILKLINYNVFRYKTILVQDEIIPRQPRHSQLGPVDKVVQMIIQLSKTPIHQIFFDDLILTQILLI